MKVLNLVEGLTLMIFKIMVIYKIYDNLSMSLSEAVSIVLDTAFYFYCYKKCELSFTLVYSGFDSHRFQYMQKVHTHV